ncbi:MAG: hypothetical protein AB8I08_02310 [Sandaracinaceae bacterium]
MPAGDTGHDKTAKGLWVFRAAPPRSRCLLHLAGLMTLGLGALATSRRGPPVRVEAPDETETERQARIERRGRRER